jgi:chromosome segregation ATPase
VLYLAEVKKQTRNFLGGLKTELKLLACQHSDQTWSALPNEELLTSENLDSVNEGTLWMLQLVNRQLQGTPETAAPELVRQLQKLSRLSEKLKDQQEEIDQWKQSLTYQSQELARREMELDTREAEAEDKEAELQQLGRQKQEIDLAWNRLEYERQQLLDLQNRFGYLLALAPSHSEQLQILLNRLAGHPEAAASLNESLQTALNAVQAQQEIFNRYWQDLSKYRQQAAQQGQSLGQKREIILLCRQELERTQIALEKAKIQFAVEQNVLSNHQTTLRRLNIQLQMTEDLQTRLCRLASGSMDSSSEHRIDLDSLEKMPLGQLEESLQHLQSDLDKLVHFVNDQEEELTLQCQAVEELQLQLTQVNDYERIAIEEEMNEEQERKRMLDETLVGQRRNLKERQDVLVQHLRVLRRRQGIVDFDANLPTINLDPVINHLEGVKRKANEERNKLEADIHNLQQSLQQIQEMVHHLDVEQADKKKNLAQEEEDWQGFQREVIQLQTKVSLYEAALQPLQDQLDCLRPQVESLADLLLTT